MSHSTIQASTHSLHPLSQVCSMFYWNQRELLSVSSHRCREMAAGPWQLSKGEMKARAAWQHEALSQAGNVLFFQMKDGQEHSVLVMATGATPHLQPVTLTGPLLSHPILQSPRRASWQLPHQPFSAMERQQQVPQALIETGCYASP